jgi:microcystin degradation protein MlrC
MTTDEARLYPDASEGLTDVYRITSDVLSKEGRKIERNESYPVSVLGLKVDIILMKYRNQSSKFDILRLLPHEVSKIKVVTAEE